MPNIRRFVLHVRRGAHTTKDTMDRIQELVDVVLAEFADMNIGPNVPVPTRTIYQRVCNGGLMWSEVHPAWSGQLTRADCSPLRQVASPTWVAWPLTDAGYQRSRGE